MAIGNLLNDIDRSFGALFIGLKNDMEFIIPIPISFDQEDIAKMRGLLDKVKEHDDYIVMRELVNASYKIVESGLLEEWVGGEPIHSIVPKFNGDSIIYDVVLDDGQSFLVDELTLDDIENTFEHLAELRGF